MNIIIVEFLRISLEDRHETDRRADLVKTH